MAFELADLPYDYDALEPHVSAETLRLHHGKHRRSYVNKLNEAVEEAGLEDLSLEEVIQQEASRGQRKHQVLELDQAGKGSTNRKSCSSSDRREHEHPTARGVRETTSYQRSLIMTFGTRCSCC